MTAGRWLAGEGDVPGGFYWTNHPWTPDTYRLLIDGQLANITTAEIVDFANAVTECVCARTVDEWSVPIARAAIMAELDRRYGPVRRGDLRRALGIGGVE